MPRTGGDTSGAAAAIVLHGEERFLVDERARSVLAEWTPALVSDFGLEVLEGSGLQPARLQDAVLQAPFLDPYRVVHVRMVHPNRADSLSPAVVQIPTTTHLLITVAGRLAAASKLAKAVGAAGGSVVEMQHLRGRALQDWAARRAANPHGLPAALGLQVVRSAPADLAVIDSELAKLSAYKASGFPLTPDAVRDLLAGGREDEIFKLTDSLLPHPTAHALDIARGLARGGMQPTSVAYRMARHIATVLEVRARQDRGESLQQVQEEMPEHNFVLQKAYDSALHADPSALESALVAIRDYEWEVKSGQVDAELGLEVLLARL